MATKSQPTERVLPISTPSTTGDSVSTDDLLTQAQAENARLREELARFKERLDDHTRKNIAAEMAQRAAEEEVSRVREEAEARRRVELSALEKRVSEEVLRTQANEVAKRRKAEQEVARLRADLQASEQTTEQHRKKSDEALQRLVEQERGLRQSAHAEVEKYKAAAKEAWQSAEEEVERLAADAEKARVELREEQVRRKRLEQELLKLRRQLTEQSSRTEVADAELADAVRNAPRERAEAVLPPVVEQPKQQTSDDDIRRLQAVYRAYSTDELASSDRAAEIPTLDAMPVKGGGIASAQAKAPTTLSEAPQSPKASTTAETRETNRLGSRFAVVDAGLKRGDAAQLIPGVPVSLDESLVGAMEDAVDEFEDDFNVFYPTEDDLVAAMHAHVSPRNTAAAAHAPMSSNNDKFFNDVDAALAVKAAHSVLRADAADRREPRALSASSGDEKQSHAKILLILLLLVVGAAAGYVLLSSPGGLPFIAENSPQPVSPSASSPTALEPVGKPRKTPNTVQPRRSREANSNR